MKEGDPFQRISRKKTIKESIQDGGTDRETSKVGGGDPKLNKINQMIGHAKDKRKTSHIKGERKVRQKRKMKKNITVLCYPLVHIKQ